MSDPTPVRNGAHGCAVLLRRSAWVRVDPGQLGGLMGLPAHIAAFLLFGWLRSLRAWLRATRAARSTGFCGVGGTEPVRKCGGCTRGLLRGHRLMMQPAFSVVFWCEPERQQSGLAVLEEGHRAMRR